MPASMVIVAEKIRDSAWIKLTLTALMTIIWQLAHVISVHLSARSIFINLNERDNNNNGNVINYSYYYFSPTNNGSHYYTYFSIACILSITVSLKFKNLI